MCLTHTATQMNIYWLEQWTDLILNIHVFPLPSLPNTCHLKGQTQWLPHHSSNTTAIHSLCLYISWSLCLKFYFNILLFIPQQIFIECCAHPPCQLQFTPYVILSETGFQSFPSPVFSRPPSPLDLSLWIAVCQLTYMSFSTSLCPLRAERPPSSPDPGKGVLQIPFSLVFLLSLSTLLVATVLFWENYCPLHHLPTPCGSNC